MNTNEFRVLTSLGLLVLCVGVGGSLLAAPSGSDVPAIIATGPDHGGVPVWVAARVASADGGLRLGLFGEGSRRNLEEQVSLIAKARKGRPDRHLTPNDLQPVTERAPYLSEGLCESTSVIFSPPEVPRDSFDALHRHARDVLRGRIVDIDQGFVNGLPSSLFEVQIDDVLRSSGDFAASRTLYVVYPYAVFRIGDSTFCRKEPEYSYRPQIDDHILLFPASVPIDAHHLLVWPQPEEVIAEKLGGGLVVAKSLQGQEPFAEIGTLDQLIERFRAELERGSEGGS